VPVVSEYSGGSGTMTEASVVSAMHVPPDSMPVAPLPKTRVQAQANHQERLGRADLKAAEFLLTINPLLRFPLPLNNRLPAGPAAG
jgi:hypothetical protein